MGMDSGHPARGWFTAETAAQKARLAEGAWKMLIHLPIIILTFLHPTPIADTAPRFDIARECQSEGGSKEEQKRCADEETQARDTLQNGMDTICCEREKAVLRGNQHRRHSQLCRIPDVPRNGEGCEEPAEVMFAELAPARRHD